MYLPYGEESLHMITILMRPKERWPEGIIKNRIEQASRRQRSFILDSVPQQCLNTGKRQALSPRVGNYPTQPRVKDGPPEI